MPNVEPQDLPIRKTRSDRSPVCGSGTCIDVKETDGAMLFTSTIAGNESFLTATYAETNAFLDEVKAGDWDHLYRRD